MMIPSKALECPICYQEYDLEQRMPMILVDCGHTICQYCLKHLIDDPKCPLDKKAFRRKDLSLFPVNFSLKGVIEENLEWDRCKEDGEKIEFICKTDKCRVCLRCWHYDKHQDHATISANNIKVEFENKKQELDNALKMIMDYYKTIEEFLDGRKEYLQEQIEKRAFGQVRFRKSSLLFDLTNYMNYEKQRLACTLNHGFSLKHDIVEKLKRLHEIQSKAPWEIFDEHVSELALRVKKVLERRNYEKIISKRVSEVEDHFETLLVIATQDQEKEEEEASFHTRYLDLQRWFEERCPEEEENFPVMKPFDVKTSPYLSIVTSPFSNIGLLIKISSASNSHHQQQQPQKQTIDLQTWREENAFTLVFEGNLGISEKDLEMIYMIRWHLKHIKTVNLVLNNITRELLLLNILSILCLLLDKVDQIFLVVHCQHKTNLDDLFLLLKDKFLAKICSRANFCLYFEFVEIKTAAFKNLVESAKKLWPSHFSLQKEGNITKIDVGSSSKDRDLSNLLSLMPERYFNFIRSYDYPYYYTDLYEDIEEYEYFVDYEF